MSKEQIEEMAVTTCSLYRSYLDKNCAGNGVCDFNCHPYDRCKKLYEKGYRKQSEWISVDERLPSNSGKYICCTTKGTILIERFYQLDDGGWFSNHNFCTVTHWMPLPEAPKMKGGAE